MNMISNAPWLGAILMAISLLLSGCEDPEVSAVRSAYEMGEAAIGAKNWEGVYQAYSASAQKQIDDIVRLAKTANREQTRALSPGLLYRVLELRAGCEPARLKTLNSRSYFGWCEDMGIMVVDAEHGISEKSIKVTDDRAVLTTQNEDFESSVELIKENGNWKYVVWTDPHDDRELQRVARENGDNWVDGMLNLVLSEHDLEKPRCPDPWNPPS